ncbi:hypothetical protein [Cohnella caldifontis]|uniref:hypothetical protein n=1 Tax=Cohnella caldifontis TaxID=3027471 RepID=UPI0023EC7F94|nr:hypothetical protein [Cohnella sp. YIM B05605]
MQLKKEPFVKLIRSYVKMHADRGFVPYRNVSGSVQGAETVLRIAGQALNEGDSLRAVRVGFCVIEEMADLLQMCDDSDGIVGGLIEETLGLIAAATAKTSDTLSSKEKRLLLDMILKETRLGKLGDWRISLLESAVHLVEDAGTRQLWEDCVRKFEDQDGINEWDSYFTREVAMLKYRLIERFDGQQSAADYLRAN